MPWSGSARLNHPHLMRQAAWLPAEGSPLWDTWRSRTLGSAAAPTGACGSSGPPPERDGRSGSLGTWRLRTPPERSAKPWWMKKEVPMDSNKSVVCGERDRPNPIKYLVFYFLNYYL